MGCWRRLGAIARYRYRGFLNVSDDAGVLKKEDPRGLTTIDVNTPTGLTVLDKEPG